MCSQVPRLLQGSAVPFLPAGEESTAIRPFGFLTGFFFTVELKCELPDKEQQGLTFTQLPCRRSAAPQPACPPRWAPLAGGRAPPALGLSRGAGCAAVPALAGVLLVLSVVLALDLPLGSDP